MENNSNIPMYPNKNKVCIFPYFLQVVLHTRTYTLVIPCPGNTKGGSITVPLTSCLTGLDWSVLQIKTKTVSCHTTHSKPVKQEVNGTLMVPSLVFPALSDNLSRTPPYHLLRPRGEPGVHHRRTMLVVYSTQICWSN